MKHEAFVESSETEYRLTCTCGELIYVWVQQTPSDKPNINEAADLMAFHKDMVG